MSEYNVFPENPFNTNNEFDNYETDNDKGAERMYGNSRGLGRREAGSFLWFFHQREGVFLQGDRTHGRNSRCG